MKRVAVSDMQSSQGVSINMSPLIDCVFLLLIFFVVTTVFVEETGVTVQKPRAAAVEDLDKQSIMLGLTDEGKIVYAGREIGLNSVRGLVVQLLKEKDVPVIVIADEGASTGPLVDVIDECKLAGAKRVSIAANREL